MRRTILDIIMSQWQKSLSTLMDSIRLCVVVLALSGPWLVACEPGRAAVRRDTPTIRLSSGLPTGTFGPFTEALARGYAELEPELRIALVDTPGSVRNLEALESGAVDLGLAQAGIAYMAYNGRLPGVHRPLRNIRGVAVLNSATVHLLIGRQRRASSINELNGLRVGVGVLGTGNAVTSELLLSPYTARAPRTVGVVVGTTADMLLAGRIDAAFTISGIPHDEVGRATRDGARLVDVSGPAIDRLRSAYPFFRSAVITAGTYPNQRQPVQTLSIDIVLLTRRDLDDGVVRRLTAGLFEMLPRLTSQLDFLRGIDSERAPATPVPLHRGATLYYRELELRR
jgi:TRAP transporter TAXI family solute receptor